MNEEEKSTFSKNFISGLVTNIIVDGKNIVSFEPNKENLKSYFEELNKNENGKEIVLSRIMELLEELILPIADKLSKDQKSELLSILESK